MFQGFSLKCVKSSLAVSHLLIVAIAIPAHAVTLEWKFAPGDEEDYRVTQSAQLTDPAANESKPLAEVEQELDLHWKVLEVGGDGNARISLTVSAFTFLAKGPDGQEVRYDSQSTEEPQGYAAMLMPIGKRLAESAVEFTLSPSGVVTDMKLPDDLAEAVKSVPSGKKFAKDGGLKSFEALARLGAPLVFPSGEISEDQEWSESREIELPVLGKIGAEFVYKVVGTPTENEATIEQRIRVSELEKAGDTKFINQDSAGTIVFNVQAGRPETSELTYHAELQGAQAEGPMKLEYSVEFRRIADESQ